MAQAVTKKPSDRSVVKGGAQAAAAEAEQQPAKLQMRPADQLQRQVRDAQVREVAQNAFITGVDGLPMAYNVSNCSFIVLTHF